MQPLHSGRLNDRRGVVAGAECCNLGRPISGALMIAATSLSVSPRNIAARANCTTCRSSLAILTACFALLVIHCLWWARLSLPKRAKPSQRACLRSRIDPVAVRCSGAAFATLAAVSTSFPQSRHLGCVAAVMFPPTQCSHRKRRSREAQSLRG